MTREEGARLQHGMNFRLRGGQSVILMSVRPGAPYNDKVLENGRVLIYEGHDVSRRPRGPGPKTVDQPMHNPSGTLSRNGRFYEAAMQYKKTGSPPEIVKVYERISPGWVYNGRFKLVDSWQEQSGSRQVFKFRLELASDNESPRDDLAPDHTRMIPSSVKLEVWKRDKGQCVLCGSHEDLHYDHIIPYSKGGSSLDPTNIRILCARHNLMKRDRIE